MPPEFLFAWTEGGMFLFVFVVTSLVAAAIHGLMCLSPMRNACARLSGLSPVLQTICGTLFVLSVTFLANSVWDTEARARDTVNDEARSLRIMSSYMDSMTGPSRDGLAHLIRSYAEGTADEWPDMAKGDGANAEQALAELYRAVIQGFVHGDQNRLFQSRMLAALDALSLARAQRLTMAQQFVSGGQWFTVVSLGLLLLVVISVCHAQSAAARAAALGFVVVAVSVSLHVIIAHDRPFVGHLAITADAIVNSAAGT